ncbi:MAG TPA: YraN family protein [bacterium]|nr:YraN family protein [bacterium]
MPHARRLFGDRAEQTAEQFLNEKGYVVLDRQFLTRVGEIDLIAKQGNEVVFVEVKARHTDAFGYPEASVSPAKLRKIGMTALLYLRLKQLEDSDFRIDVIAIEYQFSPPRITHFEGVG